MAAATGVPNNPGGTDRKANIQSSNDRQRQQEILENVFANNHIPKVLVSGLMNSDRELLLSLIAQNPNLKLEPNFASDSGGSDGTPKSLTIGAFGINPISISIHNSTGIDEKQFIAAMQELKREVTALRAKLDASLPQSVAPASGSGGSNKGSAGSAGSKNPTGASGGTGSGGAKKSSNIGKSNGSEGGLQCVTVVDNQTNVTFVGKPVVYSGYLSYTEQLVIPPGKSEWWSSKEVFYGPTWGVLLETKTDPNSRIMLYITVPLKNIFSAKLYPSGSNCLVDIVAPKTDISKDKYFDFSSKHMTKTNGGWCVTGNVVHDQSPCRVEITIQHA